MAEHKPIPVAGYKPQSSETVELVNLNKQLEEQCLRVLDRLAIHNTVEVDKRWLAIGRTDLEQAWMAINRSIFQPTRVKLPND